MIVSDLMSRGLVSILPEDTVESAARLLSQHGVGALPVCTMEGDLRGMITDRDIAVRCVAADFPPGSTQVRGVMSRAVVAVESHADVREAAKLMAQAQVRRLPVLESGKVVGMISLGDLAKSQSFDMEASKALAEISLPKREF